MKRRFIIIILTVVMQNTIYAQNGKDYPTLINEAWKLYQAKKFYQSGQKYNEAFNLIGKGIVNDRYNAACSWALANEIDSSFVQLFIIAQKGNFSNLEHIKNDPDFNILHHDKRWNEILELVKNNKKKAEANLDKHLVEVLDTIYQNDQKYRNQIRDIEQVFGWESEQMRTHLTTINIKDSINLIKVKQILDTRGWLGAEIVGKQGNQTLFLVIQHANLDTQEKYLQMMKEATKKGNANPGDLALLEDRIAIRNGNKQIYGSQIGRNQETGKYYVYPLTDPDNVDKRRSEVGLEPLQNYTQRFGFNWDAEEHKQELAKKENIH